MSNHPYFSLSPGVTFPHLLCYPGPMGLTRIQTTSRKLRMRNCCFHISYGCLPQAKALRFSKQRDQFVQRLRNMREKYPVEILNYLVGPDRYRLLLAVAQPKDISKPLAFLHLTTTQDHCARKGWVGSVWKGKYNLTLIQSQPQALRCSLDMDFTMVRESPEDSFHPLLWKHTGHHELSGIRKRYRLINRNSLQKYLMDVPWEQFREWYIQASNAKWSGAQYAEEEWWEKAIVVGEKNFCEQLAKCIPQSRRSLLVYPPPTAVPGLEDAFSWSLIAPFAYKRKVIFSFH